MSVVSSTVSPRRKTVQWAGSGYILAAACLWGTTGTVQAFSPAGAGPVSVGAARIVLGGLLLLGIAARRDGLSRLWRRGPATWALLVLGAVCVAVYQVAYFGSVRLTGVATGTVVTIGSGPVFAGLLALLLRQRRLSRRWALSTAGAVLGCGVLVSGGQAAGVAPLGVALALLSGLGYALYATAAAYLINRGEDDPSVLGAMFGGAGLLLAPVLVASAPGWLLTGQGLLIALYLGVVTTTGGYLLYGRGLRTTSAPVGTTLTLAEPAIAAGLGVAVLGEVLGGAALAGLGLLGGSLLLLVLPARKPDVA